MVPGIDQRKLAAEAVLLLQHRDDLAIELRLEFARLTWLDLEFHISRESHYVFPSVVRNINSLNIPP
jgi:hypothetical protein